MLLTPLIHPEILRHLAAAGHHSLVLIADGNYPVANKKGPRAAIVHLNLAPGLLSVDQVLRTLLAAVPIDAVQTMAQETEGEYALPGDPPVWDAYRRTIADSAIDLQLQPIEKWAFYDAVATPDHVLTIQTGDQEPFANVLLTLGCRTKGNAQCQATS